VEFRVPADYLDSAEVAIVFERKIRVFGSKAEAPSDLQKISCTPTERGTHCTMGPLKAGEGTFKVTMATDVERPPVVQLIAKNVELKKADNFVSSKDEPFWRLILVVLAAALASSLGSAGANWAANRFFLRRKASPVKRD